MQYWYKKPKTAPTIMMVVEEAMITSPIFRPVGPPIDPSVHEDGVDAVEELLVRFKALFGYRSTHRRV